MERISFSTRLNEAILIRNIKPIELSRKSGVSKSSISEYLKGKSKPLQDGVLSLAKALDVNEAWLMGSDVPMERQDNNNSLCVKNNIITIPVVGKITAGQPILASEYIEDYFPLIPEIYGINNPSEYFYLTVRGDSMNRKVEDGDYVLIHKQDYAQDGDIVVAIVNGDNEATLKKFEQINEQFVRLLPMSTNPIHNVLTIDLKETEFKIIGKAIGNFGKF